MAQDNHLTYKVHGPREGRVGRPCYICYHDIGAPDHMAIAHCRHRVHLGCAQTYFNDTPPTGTKPCPESECVWTIIHPPVTASYVVLGPPSAGVVCIICDPVSTAEPEHGNFLQFECTSRHKYHIDCVNSMYDSWDMTNSNGPSSMWRNLPCPACRTEVDCMQLENLLLDQPANIVNVPAPTVEDDPAPVEDDPAPVVAEDMGAPVVPMDDGEVTATRKRAARILSAYQALDSSYDTIKQRASSATGPASDAVLFTPGALTRRANISGLRFLRLVYKPDKSRDYTVKYTIVVHKTDTVGAMGSTWLSVLYGCKVDSMTRRPVFKRNDQYLDWASTVDGLNIRTGDQIMHEI
ncbi:hypothetical protein HBI88_100810 [Parastagonospora nodorum]|nr:hypothetical protein HBH61_138380 [Parastagonospora nodorum]KAH5074432.1 hypothetical protein HBH95_144290 [Parastagonospora nodorum]KAH5788528.1 hypothetical protein HBI97_074770 [Parastagonospora nodorum]KAH5814357.1 hypothetical protein HBI96_072070 [Parastagonospora nodorum]KAH5828492.1 hypothetical protein HBI94_056490 [Parastagonospora nodorum]